MIHEACGHGFEADIIQKDYSVYRDKIGKQAASSLITLVDDGEDLPLQEDVILNAFEDCVTIEQVDPRTEEVLRITLSTTQIRDLAAALNLPEGSYRLERKDP